MHGHVRCALHVEEDQTTTRRVEVARVRREPQVQGDGTVVGVGRPSNVAVVHDRPPEDEVEVSDDRGQPDSKFLGEQRDGGQVGLVVVEMGAQGALLPPSSVLHQLGVQRTPRGILKEVVEDDKVERVTRAERPLHSRPVAVSQKTRVQLADGLIAGARHRSNGGSHGMGLLTTGRRWLRARLLGLEEGRSQRR